MSTTRQPSGALWQRIGSAPGPRHAVRRAVVRVAVLPDGRQPAERAEAELDQRDPRAGSADGDHHRGHRPVDRIRSRRRRTSCWRCCSCRGLASGDRVRGGDRHWRRHRTAERPPAHEAAPPPSVHLDAGDDERRTRRGAAARRRRADQRSARRVSLQQPAVRPPASRCRSSSPVSPTLRRTSFSPARSGDAISMPSAAIVRRRGSPASRLSDD